MSKFQRPPEAEEVDRFELREAPAHNFEVNRREFIAAAGAAAAIAGLAEDAAAQGAERSRIEIAPDGTVTVFSGKVEEGQGPRTELAMAAAEELRVPLSKVRVVLADTDVTPSDGITAGSRTTPGTVPVVRKAAAAKRAGGGALTPPSEWKVLGKTEWRTDAREIVTAAHRFPSDIVRPGMLYGAVVRPPQPGAALESADVAAAEKMKGVTVVRDGSFIACAAPSSYAARKAAEAVTAKWTAPERPSSGALFDHLKKTAKGPGRGQPRGSIEEGMKSAARKFAAAYRVAYVQHAPMEPRAAVAEWQDGKLTVWTGTSNPFSVRDQLAQAFRIRPGQVRVIVPDFGGGFGGKHTGEAAIEAARLAKEAGKPVKLCWTRGEEFMWAYCRPAALIEVEAGLDAGGKILAWDFANYNSGAAAIDTPYAIANARIRYIEADSPLRQGSYRCLAATANNFARESFMDELAEAAGRDPLEFRMAHLENVRIKNVLAAAAEKFGWAARVKQKRPGRGVGLACGTEKNSVVAACVEVEIDKTGAPRLVEIVEAFECGALLNPGNVRSQVEGCILMGLGAALREEMLFTNGRVTNGRFSSYRVTRLRDIPEKMDIILLDRKDLEPAGAGETPIIAVAPAMANAMFSITGRRVRRMPLRVES
jgi:isoquinoline 1-oxidoreductase